VVGGAARDIAGAAAVTTLALSGLHAVAGWPAAPRPVAAEDLLPERTINGDQAAREQLIDTVYRPLTEAGDAILDTVVAYLDSGRALESTARALFVHTNTVRYRLRRAADLCGHAPTDARGAFTIQLAMVLGRLADLDGDVPHARSVVDHLPETGDTPALKSFTAPS
nr:helix-turn-helix domain-containing protein [Actinomycetota bacterium]